jgi:hypothetical protein
MPNLRRHLSSKLGYVNTTTSAEKKCLRLRFYRNGTFDPGRGTSCKSMQFKFMSNKVWRSGWYTQIEGRANAPVKDRDGYKLLLGIIENDGPIEPLIDWMIDHFPTLAGEFTKYVEAANAR